MKKPVPAKISRPRLFGASPRTRLFARLDGLRGRPLIWITGPPGSGKTTLVASYLESRQLAGPWIQADRADADLATFFYFLGLAASHAAGDGKALPLFRPEYQSDVDAFARQFFRILFERLGENGVLVIDNFHAVPEESGCVRLLELACEEIPQGSNLFVLSRQNEPSALARAQAGGWVGRLEWEDLRITPDEAALIARTRQAVSETTIESLYAECDGWAAGLTLMLDRLQRTGRMPNFRFASDRETVFNYFASQIFEQTTPHEQRTLCLSALLPEMTPRSVQALAGDVHAAELLESFYRRNLFVYRRESTESVYQYHALFRSFLISRWKRLADGEKTASRIEAARLLEKTGAFGEAISLYYEGGQAGSAIELILVHAPGLIAQGRSKTLTEWIEPLPDARLDEEPWLRYWLGVAQLATTPDRAQETLTIAHTGFVARENVAGRIMVATAILHAYYVSYARFSPTKEWIVLLSDLLKSGPELPSKSATIQANSVMLLAHMYRHARPAEVEFWACNLEKLILDEAPPQDLLMAGMALLFYSTGAGRHDVGYRTLDRLCPLEPRPEIGGPILIMWFIRKADFLHQVAQPRLAIDTARMAYRLALEHGQRYAQLFACSVEGQAQLKVYDFNEANRLIDEINRLCDRTKRVEALHACGIVPFRNVYNADYDLALRDGLTAFELAKATRVPYFFAVWVTPVLCGYAGSGRGADALRLIEEARAMLAETTCKDWFEIVCLQVEAFCALKADNREDSIRLILRALELARAYDREGFLRWTGALLPPVLLVVLQARIQVEQVRRIIRRFEIAPPKNAVDPDWDWPMRLYCMGAFQIVRDGTPILFSGKLPKKSLALLKMLLAHGHQEIPEQQVIDALWPDEEGDAAEKALSATLLRLRRLLRDNELVRHQGGKLSLDTRRCWVDAWAFEHMLSSAPTGDCCEAGDRKSLHEALSLYRGTFLPEDTGESWSVPTRERLRAKFIHALVALGSSLEKNGQFEESIGWYLKGLDADSIVESFHQGLMRCYDKLDRKTESIAAYRRLRQTLSVTLGLQPSPTTEKLYQSIREGT